MNKRFFLYAAAICAALAGIAFYIYRLKRDNDYDSDPDPEVEKQERIDRLQQGRKEYQERRRKEKEQAAQEFETLKKEVDESGQPE